MQFNFNMLASIYFMGGLIYTWNTGFHFQGHQRIVDQPSVCWKVYLEGRPSAVSASELQVGDRLLCDLAPHWCRFWFHFLTGKTTSFGNSIWLFHQLPWLPISDLCFSMTLQLALSYYSNDETLSLISLILLKKIGDDGWKQSFHRQVMHRHAFRLRLQLWSEVWCRFEVMTTSLAAFAS